MAIHFCFYDTFSYSFLSKIFNENLFYMVPLTVIEKDFASNPIDTKRKLNVHKTFRRHPGRLLNVLCTFNVRPASTGKRLGSFISSNRWDNCEKFKALIKSPSYIACLKIKWNIFEKIRDHIKLSLITIVKHFSQIIEN